MPVPLPPPTPANLREFALGHLARFSTTRARLLRVLDRRIERWVRLLPDPDPARAAAARAMARDVVERLGAEGLVDDAAFAEARARRMARSGRSRAAIAAHLAARGVASEVMYDALPADPESELAAALTVARRRRIGPFRDAAADADERRRDLTVLARAGFPQAVAERALRMTAEDAESLIVRLRRD